MTRVQRRLTAVALAAALCIGGLGEVLGQQATSGGGGAGGGDRAYDVANEGWDGLSELVEIASEQGMGLEEGRELDFDSLDVDEPLIIVYPTEEIDPKNLARFVIAGGKVLLADDFGASDAFLKRLDLDRLRPVQGTLPHDDFVNGNPALPRLEPQGRHPLLEGVGAVVANHPAVLFNVGGPVVPFAGGGGLVYDMNLGDGKVIVVSDASLLINHMLQAGDNRRLVANAVSYLCQDKASCRGHLLAEGFTQRGRFRDRDEAAAGVSKEMLEDMDRLNEAIAEAMDQMPAAELFFYLGLLLAAGLGVYLYTIFPVRRGRPYSDYIVDAHRDVHPPQSEFDWNLSRFVHGGPSMNYALPVAIMKEIFEELFLRGLGFWPSEPGARPDVEELGRIFAVKHLGDAAFDKKSRVEGQVVALLAEFAQVPTRHRVFLEGDSYYSERDLLKLYARSVEILEMMGQKEEYERRTRSDVF